MKIRNINPLGDVAVAALGMKLVRRGEEIEVSPNAIPAGLTVEEVAGLLLTQALNWEPADDEAKALAEVVIPDHLADLEAASRATEGIPAGAPDAGEVPAQDAESTPASTEVPPTADEPPTGRKKGVQA